MKKIIFNSFFIVLAGLLPVSATVSGNVLEDEDGCFTLAFTAGFVFKSDDCIFKEMYGRGMVNIITADGCYYPWESWGIGAKISYWRAHGSTTFLNRCSKLQEVPLTFYIRRIQDLMCGLRAYGSLGGGVIWMLEKSYLGCARVHRGIGEVEVGLEYPVWRCLNLTGAFRYLFPHQTFFCQKRDVGGLDLRAGIEFAF